MHGARFTQVRIQLKRSYRVCDKNNLEVHQREGNYCVFFFSLNQYISEELTCSEYFTAPLFFQMSKGKAISHCYVRWEWCNGV